MVAARNSVGYEREPDLVAALGDRLEDLPERSAALQRGRLAAHADFVAERRDAGDLPGHVAERYDVPVVTAQETALRLYAVGDVVEEGDRYVVTHRAVSPPASTD